jgi:hypothetical protein
MSHFWRASKFRHDFVALLVPLAIDLGFPAQISHALEWHLPVNQAISRIASLHAKQSSSANAHCSTL